MFSGSGLTRVLIPGAAVFSEAKNQLEKSNKICCRPSELPIYNVDEPEPSSLKVSQVESPGQLESSIRVVRQTITKYTNEIKAYEQVGINRFNESKESIDNVISYLQKENDTMPKAGAIGIGAVTGFILGLRGGLIKRVFYASVGSLGMASLCYPKEASEYSQIGLVESKKYLAIAYNFIYGVKKGDPPMDLPTLPKLPSNIPEAWESVKDTVTSLVSSKSSNVSPNDAVANLVKDKK